MLLILKIFIWQNWENRRIKLIICVAIYSYLAENVASRQYAWHGANLCQKQLQLMRRGYGRNRKKHIFTALTIKKLIYTVWRILSITRTLRLWLVHNAHTDRYLYATTTPCCVFLLTIYRIQFSIPFPGCLRGKEPHNAITHILIPIKLA